MVEEKKRKIKLGCYYSTLYLSLTRASNLFLFSLTLKWEEKKISLHNQASELHNQASWTSNPERWTDSVTLWSSLKDACIVFPASAFNHFTLATSWEDGVVLSRCLPSRGQGDNHTKICKSFQVIHFFPGSWYLITVTPLQNWKEKRNPELCLLILLFLFLNKVCCASAITFFI